MGCRLSRLLYYFTGAATPSALPNTEQDRPKYSWETREKLDPKDFTIENLDSSAEGRLPGSISGQQFIIQNCKNSSIVLLDNIGSITVDDCSNCRIIVGPVLSSIFLRNCKDCVFIVACGQFRMRDCRSSTVSLFCATQPIIESSSGVKLSCYRLFYPELSGQFEAANLSIFDNNWFHVHDFTPSDAGSNWETIKAEEFPKEDFVHSWELLGDKFDNAKLSFDEEKSVVPQTSGEEGVQNGEIGFVCFFSPEKYEVWDFLKILAEKEANFDLVKTKQIQLTSIEAGRIFGATKLPGFTSGKIPVIGLQFSGFEITEILLKVKTATKAIYIAEDSNTAGKQAETFFCFADMTMGA